uniref:Arrestin C-terminal-like domain-containing protein n=1 Tax=Strombidinopsis acuminata TaxID=141414 RepID=A0A7S3WIR5_9SPIT|mmetsp:Transcript_36316/g.49234  ORF Transcript_36316/g.49234 Transcript_36316/m.49234 type:complete len:219 (+) Transcript_36316:604-1260(+)|eukprot:CAMPEP_0176368250 /NCGR_PEP_ID=MMETSP0126-20121128/22466_1 /TAXON_ID=141414 ORGANISM="Strombidinopsis acuminatum, Strain SPMC142" /NCGR_SAMPLE_ID=MMETSP0126 /ASSEMBLY_ACC=CAM_ASM_000229 /LENGTH=218 /DNA_ID=CAMNT_0017726431 /DNA_START=605 /DNA_END=1261 /DNA_ORIENTATION=-
MQFTAGEKIPISFNIDNSQSDIKVSYYKIKLSRKLKTQHMGFNRTVNLAESKVDANCAAKGTEQVTLDLQIPDKEIDYTTYTQGVSDDDLPIKDTFSPSTVGKYFNLSYILKVTVKHDVFNEKSDNMVAFKKEIFIQPTPLGLHDLKQQEDAELKKPDQWDPAVEGVVVADSSEQAHNAEMNEYYRDILVPAYEANVANLHKNEVDHDDDQEEAKDHE